MTKVKWKELSKEMENIKPWVETLHKETQIPNPLYKNPDFPDEPKTIPKRVQLTDLGKASWRVIYNDGTIIDDNHKEAPNGNYDKIPRTNVKSIGIVDEGGTVLHTVQVKNDKFLICMRNLIRPFRDNQTFQNPKRCFILATDGTIDFIWDDGDIDELDQWGDKEPYTKPTGGAFDL